MSTHLQVTRRDHPKASSFGLVYEHILVAEQALGHLLPPKAHVHHVDGNPRNNVNSNLVICQDMAYHKLLHYRTKIVRAGGDPNTQKFCRDCGSLKPLDAFNVARVSKCSGRQSVCAECQHRRYKQWMEKNGPRKRRAK